MKRFAAICLTALMISSASSSIVFAEKFNSSNDSPPISRHVVNEKFRVPEFVSGKLTKPSKENPEDIIKGYFREKNQNKNYITRKKFKNGQGQTVVKIQQTHKGIKVKGTEQSCIINEDGILETVSGISLPDIDSRIKGTIQLTENDAVDVIGKDLKKDISKTGFLSVGKAILPQEEDAIYVYEASVSFNYPCLESWHYVIDAETGEIINKEDALRFNSVTVNGKGILGDMKTMTGYEGTIPDMNIVPEYPYSLVDISKMPPSGAASNSTKILTYELTVQQPSGSNTAGDKKIVSDNDGNFVEDDNKSHAVDAHYYAGEVFDFYKERFERYSYDNNGSDIISNCHAIFGINSDGSYDKNNAAWDSVTKQLYFGDGDGETFYGYPCEPDIMGHEFTHAVVGNEVDLNYYDESGSINEGLADLFGEVFESYIKEADPDWLKFTDCYTPGTSNDAKIDFKNPRNTVIPNTTRKYPDHMDNKFVGSFDKNGVHVNAAILTKAFSLMSDGGSFRNVDVPGIGITKLSEIMYKVITEYLVSPDTTFNQFSQLTLDAAASLCGKESVEYQSVKAGFLAVGIPYNTSQWKTCSTTSDFKTWSGSTSLCQLENKVYAFGGYNVRNETYLNDIWEYDISENKWAAKNKMPLPRSMSKALAVNGKINLMFGYSDPLDFDSFFTTVDEYDPAADSLNSVADLPEKTLFSYGTYTEGTILNKPIDKTDGYFIIRSGQVAPEAYISLTIQGSNDNINFVDYESIGTVDTSSTSTKIAWTEDLNNRMNYYRLVASVNSGTCSFEITAPRFRDFASVVSYNNKIYVLGGQNLGTNEPILAMDVYDTDEKQWQANLPGLYSGKPNNPVLVCIMVNNLPKIYAFGGGSSNIEVYDINNGTWSHFAGTCPDSITNSNQITAALYKGKVHFSDDWGETFIYDPVSGTWTENNDIGSYNELGCHAIYQNSMYNIGVINDRAFTPLKADKYDPLRITGFENNNDIILQWSKFSNASSVLTIDGTNVYTGTDDSFKYGNFINDSKKHLIKVSQNHPVYGNISSQNLCSVYQKIGDIDGNNIINTTDLAYLKRFTLGILTPSDLQKISADINNDNKVNSTDYTILYWYLYRSIPYYSMGSICFMIYGDVNNDGVIDMSDYTEVNESLLNGSTLSFIQTVAADVDGDGNVTSSDSDLIKQYALNENIVFPVMN